MRVLFLLEMMIIFKGGSRLQAESVIMISLISSLSDKNFINSEQEISLQISSVLQNLGKSEKTEQGVVRV